MPLPLIGAIAGANALIKLGSGLFQKAAANKIAKNNPFPNAFVQPEYEQNVALADNMARVGLPQEQYNNQLNLIGRNQAGGLATLGRSANPSAGLASLIRAGNDATMNLNAADANARQRNLMTFMQQRQILGGQRQSVWDWNNKQKYLSNLEKEQALRGAGNQNVMGALGDVTSGASQLALMGGFGGANPTSTTGNPNPLFNNGIQTFEFNKKNYNPLYGSYNPMN